MQAGGTWVAGTGKDVEQVYVNGAQPGHWTLRVTGFDVQSGFQDFSVVEFPYPDLPDLVVYSDDKAGIPGLNEDLTFTFSTDNIGSVTSGVDFEYVVSLSVDHTSTAQITQTNHDTILDAGFTIDDLLNTDASLLVWVDSDEEALEHNETNTTFVQAARLVDVILVLWTSQAQCPGRSQCPTALRPSSVCSSPLDRGDLDDIEFPETGTDGTYIGSY